MSVPSPEEWESLYLEAADAGAWNLLKKLETFVAEILPHRQAIKMQEWIGDRRIEILANHPDLAPIEEPEYELLPCGQTQPEPMRNTNDT